MAESTTKIKFEQTFYYNSHYNVLICKGHSYAIRYPSVASHLNELHKDIDPKYRSLLAQFTSSLFTNQPIYPSEPIVPLPFLSIQQNCYQCIAPTSSSYQCNFIRASEKGIKEHCRKEHQWINPRKRGRYSNLSAPSSLLWKTNILAQQFFTTGSDQRLFEVLAPSTASSSSQPELFELGSQKLQLRLREAQSAPTSSQAITPSRLEPNAWLERTRWVQHLDRFEKPALRQFYQMPCSENNTIPSVLVLAVTGLIIQAQYIATANIIGLASLEMVNRKETGEKTNEKPFNSRFQPGTINTYSNVWAKILIYLLSTWELEPTERPSYQKTPDQIEKFEILVATAQDFLE